MTDPMLGTMIAAGIHEALRNADVSSVKFRLATVVETDPIGGYCDVIVDGDELDGTAEPIQVRMATSELVAGSRALIAFTANGGAWAVGVVGTVRPLIERRVYHGTVAAETDLVSGSPITWPPGNTRDIDVPEWARLAYVRAVLHQVYAVTSVLNHEVFVAVGGADATGAGRLRIRWDPTLVNTNSKQDITFVSRIDVRGVAGERVKLATKGQRVSGTGGLRANTESAFSIDITFVERETPLGTEDF
jgi:hypothetical protein